MSDQEIFYQIENHIAFVTLNREKALNSINLNMVRKMIDWLAMWEKDDDIKAVVLRSSGDKAFCAGGDVRAIYEAGKDGINGDDLPKLFFSVEYEMNKAIFFFSKPYISLMKGITMGGGLGLSVHGSHRLVAENSMIAMPEAAIGFFADVGATYFLNKCPGNIGKYIALTGHRLSAEDAIYAKLATHFVTNENQSAFCEALKTYQWTNGNTHHQIDILINRYSSIAEKSNLEKNKTLIDKCFNTYDLSKIKKEVSTLTENKDWAEKTLAELSKGSPLSQTIMLNQLKRGIAFLDDFVKIMEMEFTISQGFMHSIDFYEGVRSVLVDKDNNPKWQFSAETLIPRDFIESFFVLNENGKKILKKMQKKAS